MSPVFYLVEKPQNFQNQNLENKQLYDVIGFIYGITFFVYGITFFVYGITFFYRMINYTTLTNRLIDGQNMILNIAFYRRTLK